MGYARKEDNRYKTIVEIAGFYGSQFINEIDWWFCYENNKPGRNAVLLTENNTLVQKRIEVVSQFVGEDNARALFNIGKLKKVTEVVKVCEDCFELLAEADQEASSREELGFLEDLGFYCSEVLRSVGSIQDLYLFLGTQWGEDLSTECENAVQVAFNL